MSLCLARPPLGGVRTGGTSVWRCSSEEAHPGREGVRQRARVRREPAGTEPRATRAAGLLRWDFHAGEITR